MPTTQRACPHGTTQCPLTRRCPPIARLRFLAAHHELSGNAKFDGSAARGPVVGLCRLSLLGSVLVPDLVPGSGPVSALSVCVCVCVCLGELPSNAGGGCGPWVWPTLCLRLLPLTKHPLLLSRSLTTLSLQSFNNPHLPPQFDPFCLASSLTRFLALFAQVSHSFINFERKFEPHSFLELFIDIPATSRSLHSQKLRAF